MTIHSLTIFTSHNYSLPSEVHVDYNMRHHQRSMWMTIRNY